MEVVEDRLRVDLGRCIGQFICAWSESQFITDHAVAKAPDGEAIDGQEGAVVQPDTNGEISSDGGQRLDAIALEQPYPSGQWSVIARNFLQLGSWETRLTGGKPRRTILYIVGHWNGCHSLFEE